MSLHTKLTELEKAAIGEADTKSFGLKPCPFPHCGSRRLYLGRTKQNSYCVECLDCGGRSIEADTLEEAIEEWGRQVPHSTAQMQTA
ncbi:MAG TPA: Lar family restriction alleviation protein [Clostridia bacterium]|nr:Lar family restriction alleviation protein [Clostridia bacterium]